MTAVVVSCALECLPAPAESLRALDVDALSMRVDRARVAVGEVFHLAIHVRVRQNVAALDELVVPDVGTMQLEGDERRVSRSPAGTDVVETLTLEPKTAGTFRFKGAYLDAIDARTHKPSRFSANSVRVVVGALAPPTLWDVFGPVWRLMVGIMLAGLAACVVLAAIVGAARRPRRRVPPTSPSAPPPTTRTPLDEVADALRTYRSAPAHGSLSRLRAALFVACGTDAGATLRDALDATADSMLQGALIAAQRAAFGPAHHRDAASVELIGSTDRWLTANAAGRSV